MIILSEKQKEKRMKINKQRLKDNIFKLFNLYLKSIPKRPNGNPRSREKIGGKHWEK